MDTDNPRRSRTAWPGPLSIAGVGEGHAHDLPEALIKTVRSTRRALYVIGLCLVAVCVLLLLIIFERGAMRDAENQRIKDTFCEVFDTLPEGGVLDESRRRFDCGPGRPLDSFPDDVRRRFDPPPPAVPVTPAAPTPTQNPPMGAPAVPNPPRPTPNEPPAGNSPKPTPPPAAPSTTPAGVLEPVTDTVCDLINVCIEEP